MKRLANKIAIIYGNGAADSTVVKEGAKVYCTIRELDKQKYFVSNGLDKKVVKIKCDLKEQKKLKQEYL